MKVGREALLRFDGAEVLHVVPGAAAQGLPELVHQPGEEQSVEGSAAIVVAHRVGRDAGAGNDRAVAVQGEGEEHRRPVGLADRASRRPDRWCGPP